MKNFILAAFCLFSIIPYLQAEDEKKNSIQENPSFAMIAHFSLVDRDMDFWDRTPSGIRPMLSTTKEVSLGQFFRLVLLFQSFQIDDKQQAKITCKMSLKSPSGKVVDQGEFVACDGIVPSPKILLLSKAIAEMKIDGETGIYTLDLVALDHIGNKEIQQKLEIQVNEWKLGETPSAENYEKWFTGYYKSPNPNQAIRAYLKFSNILTGDNQLRLEILNFFKIIFERNPYLIEYLKQQHDQAEGIEKAKILIMLHLLGDKELLKEAAKDSPQIVEAIKQVQLVDPYGTLEYPSQLDMLWADFFATGRIKPIRKLVSALGFQSYSKYVKSYQTSKKAKEDFDNLLKGVMFQAAHWSISSNCEQHELVRNYCLSIFLRQEEEKLSSDEALILATIISPFFPEYLQVNLPEEE